MMERPWGRMWRWFPCRWLWVKIIRVNYRACTSLQQHKHRSELHISLDRWKWRVVRPFDVHSMHTGLYLEIAWGHPAEEDIIRLTDLYGRK